MKTKSNTSMHIIIITMAFFIGFSVAIKAQNELLAKVESSLNSANSRAANILCPQEYSEAVQHYNEAKTYVENGESIADVKEELELASGILQKMNLDVDEKAKTFNEIIIARNEALTSKADKYALTFWGKAEDEFRDAVEEYSDGELVDVQYGMPHCILLYNSAHNYSSYADSLVLRWAPLQNANNSLANLLSPATYSDAFLKFNEALEQFSNGDEITSIERLVNQSGILFNQSVDNSKIFAERYPEVLPARNDVLQSGAATYAAYMWLDAEQALSEAGLSFEENETGETPELVKTALQKYRAAKNFILAAQLFPDLDMPPKVYSMSIGFGFDYPRYISTILRPEEGGFGGFVSLSKYFSEYAGLRLSGNYLHIEAKSDVGTQKTELLVGNIDFIYNFVPFTSVSPYFTFGAGGMRYELSRLIPGGSTKKSDLAYQLNFGLGVESRLSETLKLKTELNFHLTSTSNIDGINNPNPGGVFGGFTDTYSKFEIGLNYYFGKGKPSGYYDLYKGISSGKSSEINYDRIESIVKKYQVNPDSIVNYERFEDIVQKYQSTGIPGDDEAPVLVGVNFAVNSSRIEPEAAPVLYYDAQILFKNPAIKLEIYGYTDNVGSELINQKLSMERAMAVKNYLTAVGVEESRLTAIGFGSKNPLATNAHPEGRSMNRRVEFKIVQ